MNNETKSVLEQIAEEGFKDTHLLFADLKIYESSTEYILYDVKNECVHSRYSSEKTYLDVKK